MEFDDKGFLSEFCMTKSEIKDLCSLLREPPRCMGNRKCGLTVGLIALKTLGTGNFQNSAKDQPLVSNVHVANNFGCCHSEELVVLSCKLNKLAVFPN